MQTGTAPIPCSSGQRTQHRLNRGGDRQLNHALHIIAITRAQHDPATKEYLARKEAEGKTTKGALRSLKRHLARRFYHLLAEPPADQQQTAEPEPIPSRELPAIPSGRAACERSSRSARRQAQWSASARPPRHATLGAFSGALAPAMTGHGRRRTPQIAAIDPRRSRTGINRRVLSPSAAVAQPRPTNHIRENDRPSTHRTSQTATKP